MRLKSHHYKRFRWSFAMMKEFILLRKKEKYDINILITGKRGRGKTTWAIKLHYRFPEFNPEENICYTREKMNKNLMTPGGNAHGDEGVVNFSKGNTITKGNKELFEIITKNRDNEKLVTWCIPSIENVDLNILQYCCCWIHVDKRGIGAVFLPVDNGIFSKDSWRIEQLKKQYKEWMEEKRNKANFPFWKFPNFRGWFVFSDLGPRQKETINAIKQRDKNASMQQPTQQTIDGESPKQNQVIFEPLQKQGVDYDEIFKKVLNKEIVSNRQLNDIAHKEGVRTTSFRKAINERLKIATGGKTLRDVLY